MTILPTIKVTAKGLAKSLEKDINLIEKNADRIHSGLADEAISLMAQATTRFRRSMAFVKRSPRPGNYIVLTEDKRFVWLNEGTKSHPISAKPGKHLIFQWARAKTPGRYKAKSRPSSIKPGGNGLYRGGTDLYGTPKVKHPGSKKRNYSGIVRRRILRLMKQRYKEL